MLRATKVRIYPTREQAAYLDAQFGAVRFVYNKALAIFNHFRKRGRNLNIIRDIKPLLAVAKKSRRYAWLGLYDSLALQEAVRNLDTAFKNFFGNPRKYGKPVFKKKHGIQKSYHTQNVSVTGNTIKIPKMPAIRAKIYRPVEGRVTSITLSRTPSGKYYASILIDDGMEAPKLPKQIEKAVGIDLGISTLLADSDGKKAVNIRPLEKALEKTRWLHRKLSRKKKGSANRAKARKHLANHYERLSNVRDYYQHVLSKRIIDENQAVMVEDLNIRGMMKRTKGKGKRKRRNYMGRPIADAGWGEFLRKLKYKAERAGVVYHEISRWEPSSKRCSACGHVYKELGCNERKWDCPHCCAHHDRDLNAALNILRKGLQDLESLGYILAAGLSATAHGGCVRPARLSGKATADEVGSSA